ncbi:DUF4397 domain-containing protein [Amnibacterium endophyticum]|uniref:DUF4397 domain-containing protein n=1 Tax=Amnibacterium endophyticum TaxID=2109337 RepID=A0ABW4LH27_9MICO
MRTTHRIAGALVGATALAVAAAAPAQASTADASLSVLHAVPDTPVDVYVNGERQLDDFEPGDLAGPLRLPGGSYSVAITAADATDDSDPVIGPIDLPLEAGGNYTAAAHLDADGQPTATLFTNDTSATEAGQGRLTVRHTAAAPAVDVLAGGDPVIEGLENPDGRSLDLPAGTVSASVAAAGTTDPVIGPADVQVQDGVNTILYAWGSLEDDTLQLATQTIDGLGGAPDGVNTGTGGLAAEGGPSTGWLAGGAAVALIAVIGTALAVRARRS